MLANPSAFGVFFLKLHQSTTYSLSGLLPPSDLETFSFPMELTIAYPNPKK